MPLNSASCVICTRTVRPAPDGSPVARGTASGHYARAARTALPCLIIPSVVVPWQFANRAGDDLLTLLGDIHIEADGGPTDPAAWDDWMACVRAVKERNVPEQG
jgi:hypothetical protein